jgi:predicted O-methyltransferase YrrM
MNVHEQAVADGAQQDPQELLLLHDLLQTFALRQPIRRVLEVGSWRGGMLRWFERVLPNAFVVSVDLMAQIDADLTIVGDSHTPEVYDQVRQHAPFQLVFIDGDHSYAGCMRDWELYGPLVSKPGLVAFHDIATHPPQDRCEVDRVWRELKELFPVTELVGKGDLGIGVLTCG